MPTQTGSLDLKSGNDASKTATNYITEISTTDGIKVHNANDTSNYAQINSSGMNVVQSGVSVASFGASARVGKESGGHSIIDENGMKVYGGSNGTTELVHIGYGLTEDEEYGPAQAPYYTFGTRGSGYIGMYSFVSGEGNVAGSSCAHAEGYHTSAFGHNSHTEGASTETTKNFAHAEGSGTKASGIGAHAEGVSTIAGGYASHAQNTGTRASSDNQTAIGQYNQYGNVVSATYSLIIGNGTDDNNRSNALAVTWDGNVHIDLAGYQTANSTDKAIYDALVSLGWESEVTA